jgi:hypothetical protein
MSRFVKIFRKKNKRLAHPRRLFTLTDSSRRFLSSSQRRRSVFRSSLPRHALGTQATAAALRLRLSATVGQSQTRRRRQRLPLPNLVNRLAPSPPVLRTTAGNPACALPAPLPPPVDRRRRSTPAAALRAACDRRAAGASCCCST